MVILETSVNQILLTGITLYSHFQLYNPHQHFSVSYHVNLENNSDFLQQLVLDLSAKRDYNVKGKTSFQYQMRGKPTLYQILALQKQSNAVTVKVSYNNELNRKIKVDNLLMKKNYATTLWNSIKNQKQILVIPVEISSEHKQIKSRLSSTLNVNSPQKSLRYSFNDLQAQVSSIGKVSIQQLSGSQINQARMKALIQSSNGDLPIQSNSNDDCSAQNLNLIELQSPKQSQRSINKSYTGHSSEFKIKETIQKKDPQYLLQILILVIISGFCISLGSNLRHLFYF